MAKTKNKRLKRPVSDNPLSDNVVNWPKHFFNSNRRTWKILRLFVNTLTADDKSLFLIEENKCNIFRCIFLKQTKIFLNCFLYFSNLFYIFNILKKTLPAQVMYLGNCGRRKTWLDKCLKSPVWEDPSTSNMLNRRKHLFNLNNSTFTIFIDHCEGYWIGKSHS